MPANYRKTSTPLAPASSATALRVAMVAPISWRVPPRHYGPWEQFVSLLTEGLVARGVDVTLFATADSLTSARLVGTAPTGYSEDSELDAKVWEALHLATVFEQADRFDLIHNSFDFLPLAFSRLVDTPMLTTIHGFSSERILPVYRRYDDRSAFIAISDSDRHPDLTYLATIHHGIDFSRFTFRAEAGRHLLVLGRIHPDKGVSTAIEVAARAGLPLVIAGIVQDQAYFDRCVRPHVDGVAVRYVGSVGPKERDLLLGDALALLHLVSFEEPFGFSVVEAMACGTPVVAHPRGSLPELIRHGLNGWLVDDVDAAVHAVEQAAHLDRGPIRADAEERFSVGRMVDAYLDAYRELLAQGPRGASVLGAAGIIGRPAG